MNIRHKVRDMIITALDLLGIAAVYRMWRKRDGSLTRIVVFHDVPDRVWFASMVETLVRETRVLTPEEFRTGVRDHERINTLITFDDGYESWVDTVLPVLHEHHIKALFFVNSGLVECASDERTAAVYMREQLSVSPKPALDVEGLQTISHAGHTIGGHTRMHFDLTTLGGDMRTSEILADKHVLEDVCGTAVTDFAYPFGTNQHLNDMVVDAVKDAGYTHAYTAISDFVHGDEKFHTPRMCIETDTTPRQIRRWIFGAYDLFVKMKP